MSASGTWLVAVCAGRWQVHGIRSAQRAGLSVFALDGDPAAPGLSIADQSTVVDVRDAEAVIEAVQASGVAPSGAISLVSEAGMLAAAALRDHFGLPGPGLDVTRRMTDKSRQRAAWDKAGLPNPPWRRCATVDEVANALDAIGRPAIIKPVDGAGSRAVRRLDRDDEWRPAAESAIAAARARAAIVEGVLPGREFTVETFGCGGQTHVLAVTVKRKVPGTKGTVADQLATPDLPASTVDAIAALAREALAALGLAEGPGHVEIMADDQGGLGLVEAAGRGGGFMVFERMVPLASGYDLATATALQAVGREPRPPSTERNAVVLRFLPTTPGVVVRLAGFEAANAIGGVEAGPFIAVGQRVTRAHSDGDRLYYVLSHAATPAKALALADRAEALIDADIASFGVGQASAEQAGRR